MPGALPPEALCRGCAEGQQPREKAELQEADGLKVPNRELWTGVGDPAGETGKSGRQGLHFQAKEPQGHPALCLFSGFVFVFVLRREVVACISTHYP